MESRHIHDTKLSLTVHLIIWSFIDYHAVRCQAEEGEKGWNTFSTSHQFEKTHFWSLDKF